MVVRQQVGDGDVVAAAADVGLLAEQVEAAHRHQHGVHVDAPQVQEEDHLQLDVRLDIYEKKQLFGLGATDFPCKQGTDLFGDADVAADVGVLAVAQQEGVAARQHLAQPPQNVRVVDDLVLDQLLRYAEQHLQRTRHEINLELLRIADTSTL